VLLVASVILLPPIHHWNASGRLPAAWAWIVPASPSARSKASGVVTTQGGMDLIVSVAASLTAVPSPLLNTTW
jgi:hypothetical protein